MPVNLLPALVACSSWFVALPPSPVPFAALVPGDATEWPLGPGDIRRHVVHLEPGEFVRATILPADIAVSIRVVAPDGVLGPDIDLSDGPNGREPAAFVAAAAGEYVIEVEDPPDAETTGHYVVDAEPVRVPDDRDHTLMRAFEARRRANPEWRKREEVRRGGDTGGPIEPAVPFLGQSAELFHGLGETCWEAATVSRMALLTGFRRQNADAAALHARALGLSATCQPYARAEAYGYAGESFLGAGQFLQAAENYERGLALAREIGAQDLELMNLVNSSSSYARLGEFDRLQRNLEEALPLLRERGLKQGEAVALRNLALSHMKRGELQQAVDRAQESLALRRQAGDRPGEGTTLVTLGEIYLALGEPATARQHLEAALALCAQDVPVTGGYQRVLTVLSRAYEEMGDDPAALAALERALAYGQLLDDRESQPQSLLALGQWHLRRAAWEPAWEAGFVAAELLRPTGDRSALANAQELQGAAWLGLGDAARARGALAESLELRAALQDGLGQAMALHQLSRVDRAQGDPEGARRRLEQALPLIEAARRQIYSPELRSTWLAGIRGIQETYVDTLMELHRREPHAGWEARAFEASEAARARSLLDLLAESKADIRQGADPELVARERTLRERRSALLERQLRVFGSGSDSPERDEIAREILAVSTEYEELRAHIRSVSPRYAALTQPRSLSLDAIRAEVLDADTLLLQYALGADRSFLWVVGEELFLTYELPGEAEIEAAVRRARETTDHRPHGESPAALAALSRMLLGPAWAQLGSRRLLIAADGPLHHVPFAALADESGRRLGTAHELVSAPSASALALLRAASAQRPQPKRTVAVLADPVFDRTDGRVHALTRASAEPDPLVQRATRAVGLEGGPLRRLVFTRREARSIVALAPNGSSRLALDFEASRATLADPDLKQYRYLHFATHGLLNDVRPELSGLVLSLVDREGHETPGLLTAPDVFNLELGADLVVLSGCRTALGKEIRGEGLIGLTRAFMYAGVPRVVASLWPVDDLTTSELMTGFYEGMLGPQKLRPAAALHRAQARMARDPRWSAPYYWAGFQLQGDWR